MWLCFHSKNKIVPVKDPIPVVDLPQLKLERRQSHGSIVTGSHEYNSLSCTSSLFPCCVTIYTLIQHNKIHIIKFNINYIRLCS